MIRFGKVQFFGQRVRLSSELRPDYPIRVATAAARSAVAEFAEVDALPRAESKTMCGDWNRNAHTEKRRLGMGWHIVEPLKRMLVIWLTLTHKAIHDARHVATHVGVGILIDCKRAGSVLHE